MGAGQHFPPIVHTLSFLRHSPELTIQWSNSSLEVTRAFAQSQNSHTIHTASLAVGLHVSDAANYVNCAIFDTLLKKATEKFCLSRHVPDFALSLRLHRDVFTTIIRLFTHFLRGRFHSIMERSDSALIDLTLIAPITSGN